MSSSLALLGIYAGSQTVELAPGIPSAIHKARLREPTGLASDGLHGDTQADRRYHGGTDRALHHYPAEHYAAWADEWPGFPQGAPGFGENLSTLGITEQDVTIGAVYRLGSALIQVSQPRSPCFKLNLRFGFNGLALRMQETGRTGWLYRVVEAGVVPPDAVLVEHAKGTMTVAEAVAIMFHPVFDAPALERLLAQPALAASWQRTLRWRLEHGQLESWTSRLQGADSSFPNGERA